MLFASAFCQRTENLVGNITDGKTRLEKQIEEVLLLTDMSRSMISSSFQMYGLSEKASSYGCNCKNLDRATEQISKAAGKKAIHDLSTRISVNTFDALCKAIINGWSCLAIEGCPLDQPYVSVPVMELIQSERVLKN